MGKPRFVVVNPMAANQRVGRDWPRYRNLLEIEMGPFDYALTQRPDHATELVRAALRDGYRDIGSLGGDGTHSLVLNGFFENGSPVAPDATLSVLPVGTGGDFKRLLDVRGEELAAYARRMAGDESQPIDVGHIRYVDHDGIEADRYFLNIASFGMGGHVDAIVNRSSKALGGKASFLVATMRAMISYRAPMVQITVDGEALEPDRIFVGAACNGQYFGGGMWIGPNADLRDGLLDLVVIPWRSRFYHLSRGALVYRGAHLRLPGVKSIRSKVIRAESESPCLLDIDGEAPGRLPVEIRVVPKAVRLKGLPAR